MGAPFCADAAVQRAITRLIDADHVTLVVGAGASVEAGLPTWPTLVRRLLRRHGAEQGLDGGDLDNYCDWVMRADGLTAAAAVVVQSNLGESDFRRWVREELYRDTAMALVPGPSARACAKLKSLLAERCELVTTNYDHLLGTALRDEMPNATVDARANDHPAKHDEAVVRHLHGIITPSKTYGDVVLAEGHYHAMQGSEQTWQESFMRTRLDAGPCVFTGTSLTDPNLLRYLYRVPSSSRHVALFTRQQEAVERNTASDVVQSVHDTASEARWRALSVEPLLADYFTDTAQFLSEWVWRLEEGDDAPPYSSRLAEWERVIERELIPRRAIRRFVRKQDELHEHLSHELDSIQQSLARDGHERARGERLGIHIWVYQPRRNALLLIGASDRVWRDPSTLVPVPVGWSTSWASVKAFCTGGLASQPTVDQPTTRWNHVIGIPLFSDSKTWGRLPLGALTVASTLPEARSVLGRGLDALRGRSWLLAERAAPLLEPPPPL